MCHCPNEVRNTSDANTIKRIQKGRREAEENPLVVLCSKFQQAEEEEEAGFENMRRKKSYFSK